MVVSLCTGCGSAVLAGAGAEPSDLQATAAASSVLPLTHEHEGVTLYLRRSESVEAAFVDDPASSVLRVAAGMDTRGSRGLSDCSPMAVASVLQETDIAVTVEVGLYGPSEQVADPLVCADIGGAPFQLEVGLSRPLGAREVLDAASGAVPVRTGDQLPAPATIPDGYSGGQLVAAEDGILSRTWYGPQEHRLTLTRRPIGTVGERDEVVLDTTVKNEPAVATRSLGFADSLCLRWEADGSFSTGMWLCSNGSPSAPLTGQELVVIATSIPTPEMASGTVAQQGGG